MSSNLSLPELLDLSESNMSRVSFLSVELLSIFFGLLPLSSSTPDICPESDVSIGTSFTSFTFVDSVSELFFSPDLNSPISISYPLVPDQ